MTESIAAPDDACRIILDLRNQLAEEAMRETFHDPRFLAAEAWLRQNSPEFVEWEKSCRSPQETYWREEHDKLDARAKEFWGEDWPYDAPKQEIALAPIRREEVNDARDFLEKIASTSGGLGS